jgi:dUTP pyrophosphatase
MSDEKFNVENELNRLYKEMREQGPNIPLTEIGLVNKSDNPNPEYETSGASGFDLRANLPYGPVVLKPLDRAIIKTGLHFELPIGYEMQVRPRSGLAAKKGVTVLNAPGTIDADFRGDVGVILVNLSNDEFVVEHGDRIAQGVFAISLGKNGYRMIDKDELSETERGSGGFGSTGVK